MLTQKLMWIVWPAFLAACVLELLVFAVVDPADLHWSGHGLGWSRQAVYSVSFFVFWWVTMAAGALTTLLGATPPRVGECTVPPAARPDACRQS